MHWDVFTALHVVIVESDFWRPGKALVKWDFCVWIKINLQSVQMALAGLR